MVDLSPEEQERLRMLEAEVDRDRENLRKKREELEQKALVPFEQSPEARQSLPVKTEPPPTLPVAWSLRGNLRRNVTIGVAALMAGFFVLHNLVFIVGSALVVGGVWYAAGKYLSGGDAKPDAKPSDKSDA